MLLYILQHTGRHPTTKHYLAQNFNSAKANPVLTYNGFKFLNSQFQFLIQEDNFLELPLTTNRLDVVVDKKAFFEKYTIVSYSSNDKEYKNLAYEQLGKVPTISVTGIRARWIENRYPFTQFFILSTKEKANDILESLRSYEQIKSKIDNLELYNDTLQKRIIASLAINSLGKKRNDKLMYNDGSLLVRDDTNFGIRPSKQDLVCLKMEINEYMNLTAKTASFTHP